MAVTINASLSAGLVQTADTTGNLSLQSNGTTIAALTSTGLAVTGAGTFSTTLGVTGIQTNSNTIVVNTTNDALQLQSAASNASVLNAGVVAATYTYLQTAKTGSGTTRPLRIYSDATQVAEFASGATNLTGTLGVTGITTLSNNVNIIGGELKVQYTSGTDTQLKITSSATDIKISATYGTTGAYVPLILRTSDTDRLTISSAGAVTIPGTLGVTGYFSGSGFGNIFSSSRNAVSEYILEVRNTNATADANTVGLTVALTGGSTMTNARYMVFYDGDGMAAANGSISAASGSTVAYNTSSDGRLKENVQDFTGALDILEKVQPRSFIWKKDGTQDYGFIAQELREVYPYPVSGKDQPDDVILQMDYGRITPLLAAAIKELVERVKQLENRTPQ